MSFSGTSTMAGLARSNSLEGISSSGVKKGSILEDTASKDRRRRRAKSMALNERQVWYMKRLSAGQVNASRDKDVLFDFVSRVLESMLEEHKTLPEPDRRSGRARQIAKKVKMPGFIKTIFKKRRRTSTSGNQIENEWSLPTPPLTQFNIYVSHLYNHTRIAPQCLVVALIYMERALAKQAFKASIQDYMLWFTVCVILASKINEDRYMNNVEWHEDVSKAVSISLKDINRIEASLLAALDFSLHTNTDEWERYIQRTMKSRLDWDTDSAEHKAFDNVKKKII
eukprot:gb/GECH01014174.1/.p1 GENE.gb/GECH01014174.1/~~gb/GECH01014174.1/.p1  ORF type:complete len:283 (+),score=60.63 gb/GECH01014174.1/:1-849(+)